MFIKQRGAEYIVAIDAGSGAIKCLVGEVLEKQVVNILGASYVPAQGIYAGLINDLPRATVCIKEAVQKAQAASAYKFPSAYYGTSGFSVRIQNVIKKLDLGAKDREIKERDILKLLSTEDLVDMPDTYAIMHSLPQKFAINESTNIKNPVGMYGATLALHSHVIMAEKKLPNQIRRCAEKVGVAVDDYYLAPAMSFLSMVGEAEREMGALFFDFGAATVTMIVAVNGRQMLTRVLNFGANGLTSDLVLRYGVDQKEAERLKLACSHAYPEKLTPEQKSETFKVMSKDQKVRTVYHEEIAFTTKERLERMIRSLKEEFLKCEYAEELKGSLVLTGGGAQIPGIDKKFEEIFEMPVRVAKPPISDKIENPAAFSAAYGMINFAYANKNMPKQEPESNTGSFFKNIISAFFKK